jgi:chromosome segregation ATPase
MNKTCLFLIFLIAPLAFCQHEILNMLDNTPEGKEVLDALFIQTKLMGENLDAASLRQFLNANYKRVQSEKAATSQHHKKRSAECKSDLKQLAAFLHEHEDRQLELKRRVEFIKRASKVNKGFLERADEELTNYKKFEGYIKQNKAAWSTYYKTVTTNFNKVSEILKNALSALRPKKGAAFVEVQEETFSTSLAEIRLQVEATDAEFVGMGPILSNLVEIMAEAVNKTEVRQKTRELVHLLIDNVRDRLEELDEENGDWGLGIGDWAQSPIPNPQSPIPNNLKFQKNTQIYSKLLNYTKNYIL